MENIASIDIFALAKGEIIEPSLAWDHYVNRKPEKLAEWLAEYGDEATAKAVNIAHVLLQVRDWIERDRRDAGLPPLILTTTGGRINILTDAAASAWLNDQAFQGLRRHQRATARLLTAVNEDMLNPAQRREHENRINVHSFIAASTKGAQLQLKEMKRAGKAPALGSRKV